MLTNSAINVTIAEGATVTLDKSGMAIDSSCICVDNPTDYISANNGTVTE